MDTAVLASSASTLELVVPPASPLNSYSPESVCAMSVCHITLPNDATLGVCIEEMRAFGAKLTARSGILYHWGGVYCERHPDGGGNLSFQIDWVDQAFFQARKNAFSDTDHRGIFARLGISRSQISVTHWQPA